jgi:hypothetical protein
MAKKRLPAEVLAYFQQQGAKGGRIGGRQAAASLTAAERKERARKGGLKAAANRRAKADRSGG